MTQLKQRTLACLQTAKKLKKQTGVVGLDGFVDTIIRVVGQKDESGRVTHIPDIPSFAERVGRAAGKSTALELDVQQVKLGGNGPIMAGAMVEFGLDLTYMGAVGAVGENAGIHPVFRPLAERCRVIPLCPAASTDALEFKDGKLMFQQMSCLDSLNYASLVEGAGSEEALLALFDRASFLALDHWASIPQMSDIWGELQRRLCPHLSPGERHLFFDLADPEKRTYEDISRALELISGFERWYKVTLGLNEKESEHLCAVLDCEPSGVEGRELIAERAAAIRRCLKLSAVAVHPVRFAVAAGEDRTAVVEGPYIPHPRISTGAGDHFNAGFFLGRLLSAELDICLQLGVACSGYYVRTTESPSLDDLGRFIRELDAQT